MKELRRTRLVDLSVAEIVCCSGTVVLSFSIALSTQLGFISQAPLGYITELSNSSFALVHKLKAVLRAVVYSGEKN